MKYNRKKIVFLTAVFICFLLTVKAQENRDFWQQPEKVMDVIGVKPGMIIGEPGAGEGYFTFHLAKRVGERGHIYANDINENALLHIEMECKKKGITNITTVIGEVENPMLPMGKMDMIIMVYVLHDLEKPVEFLRNIIPSMKPGAKLVLLEREPLKTKNEYDKTHFLTKEKILRLTSEAGFHLRRFETFLPKDSIYILSTDGYITTK
jgi:ubiquinone/menaquinone biosynthesis C-methylase UbiE